MGSRNGLDRYCGISCLGLFLIQFSHNPTGLCSETSGNRQEKVGGVTRTESLRRECHS